MRNWRRTDGYAPPPSLGSIDYIPAPSKDEFNSTTKVTTVMARFETTEMEIKKWQKSGKDRYNTVVPWRRHGNGTMKTMIATMFIVPSEGPICYWEL